METMQLSHLLYGVAVLVGLLCAYSTWRTWFSSLHVESSTTGYRLSFLLLILSLASKVVVLQRRSDLTALYTEGLSTQNRVQVVLALCALAWSAFLIVTGRVRVSSLLAGSSFWMTMLIVVFGVTAIWSVWPALTLYRTTELAVFWIVSIHLFSHPRWFVRLEGLLWALLCLYWLNGLVSPGANTFGQSGLLAAMRSNGGTTIAAILFLWSIFQLSGKNWLNASMKLILSALSIVVFGSFASAIALACALFVAVFLSTSRSPRPAIVSLVAMSAVISIQIGLLSSGEALSALRSATFELGAMFGKSTAALTSATGRFGLWAELWEVSKLQPWGFGFAAAERLFGADATLLGWAPGPGGAHNGYLSAWFGAGWGGFMALGALLVSLCMKGVRVAPSILPLYAGVLTLIAINNMTIPLIGGALNPVLVVVMAFTSAPLVIAFARNEPQHRGYDYRLRHQRTIRA